jgi:hypothetical protein
MGYLGDDAGSRTFLEGKVGTTDLGTIAKAALVLMGDKAKYASDMTAGLKASSKFVQAACAAALGIANLDDATISSVLIPLVKWEEPDDGKELGFFASHLLAMAAWDRRGWAANAGDVGPVTFYEGGTPTPAGSGGNSGAGGSTGTPTGGSTSNPPPPAGSTSVAGAKAGAVAGNTAVASGGKTTTPPPAGNITPTSSAKGGNTTPPVGGNTTVVNTTVVNPQAGKTSVVAGQPAAGAVAGNAGTGELPPVAGTTGSELGGDIIPAEGGMGGNPGDPTNSAGKGSAGGCNFGQGAPAPLAFLLAAMGLALALRRRGR